MIVIFMCSLGVADPAQALAWLPSITVVLKFLSALLGFAVTAAPVLVRIHRWIRCRACRADRGQ